jgi:hypothetical protein
VAHYFRDPTQGPRASISAFPATLLRHYSAPGSAGERFVETNARQIDLLADVFAPNSPVSSGYLAGAQGLGADALVAALETNFDRIRVGVHDGAQVVLGYNWDGVVESDRAPRIGQVFTSTVAGGGYGGERLGEAFEPACRQLLRAAYLGTLLAGISLGRMKVVLTLIGGGVFGNPISLIWEAILWALDRVEAILSSDLDVIVNGWSLGMQIDLAQIAPAVRERGGVILIFDRTGHARIQR